MTRTCGECGGTWDGRATFCGRCGALLDATLGRSDGDGTVGAWWRHPAVLGALAVAVVAGLVAAVPRVSLRAERAVDGEIGLPAGDEVADLPPGEEAEDLAPAAAAAVVTCEDADGPAPCVRWQQRVVPPAARNTPGGFPLVVGPTLLVVQPDEVVAYDLADGRRRWRRTPDADVGGLVSVGTGVALFSSGSETLALDLATGQPRWRVSQRPLPGGFGGVPDLALTVATTSDVVVARDLATGEERWRREVPLDGAALARAAGEHLVLTGGDGGIAVLDRDTGAPRWVDPGEEPAAGGGVVYGAEVLGVEGGLLVLVERVEPSSSGGAPLAAPDGDVVVRHVADGTEVWRATVEEPQFGHLVDGVAAIGTADGVVVFDVADGQERWRVEGESLLTRVANLGTPPRATDGTAVVTAEARGGPVRARAPATGAVTWASPDGTGAAGAFVAPGLDRVLLQESGGLTMLDLRSGELTGRVRTSRGFLVAVDPVVYFDDATGSAIVLDDPGAERTATG